MNTKESPHKEENRTKLPNSAQTSGKLAKLKGPICK